MSFHALPFWSYKPFACFALEYEWNKFVSIHSVTPLRKLIDEVCRKIEQHLAG